VGANRRDAQPRSHHTRVKEAPPEHHSQRSKDKTPSPDPSSRVVMVAHEDVHPNRLLLVFAPLQPARSAPRTPRLHAAGGGAARHPRCARCQCGALQELLLRVGGGRAAGRGERLVLIRLLLLLLQLLAWSHQRDAHGCCELCGGGRVRSLQQV